MPGLRRAISITCNVEKEKCEAGEGVGEVSCQKRLSHVAPCYKCYRDKLFSDHLVQSSRLLFLSISELTLLI